MFLGDALLTVLMVRVLHILTKPDDSVARRIIQWQSESPDCQMDSVDLTLPDPDYQALLDRVFAADSIQVW